MVPQPSPVARELRRLANRDGTAAEIVEGPRICRPPGWREEANAAHHFPFADVFSLLGIQPPTVFRASRSDLDTFTFDEAMRDTENHDKWMEAIEKEIQQLEAMGTWDEIPVTQATGPEIPVHWVLKIKRKPDGTLDKFKA